MPKNNQQQRECANAKEQSTCLIHRSCSLQVPLWRVMHAAGREHLGWCHEQSTAIPDKSFRALGKLFWHLMRRIACACCTERPPPPETRRINRRRLFLPRLQLLLIPMWSSSACVCAQAVAWVRQLHEYQPVQN